MNAVELRQRLMGAAKPDGTVGIQRALSSLYAVIQVADDAIQHAERLERENKRLQELLARTHAAWVLEASQGDGIMEEHRQVDLDCRAVLEGTQDDSL